MKTTRANVTELATKFVSLCREYGWTWEARRGSTIVTIKKRFPAGSNEQFAIADSEAYSLMEYVPLKGGSTWGTDGGSIGGYTGLMSGCYTLNKSGESGKRFIEALSRIA